MPRSVRTGGDGAPSDRGYLETGCEAAHRVLAGARRRCIVRPGAGARRCSPAGHRRGAPPPSVVVPGRRVGTGERGRFVRPRHRTQVIAAAGAEPTILLIDDAHALDDVTFDGYLSRRRRRVDLGLEGPARRRPVRPRPALPAGGQPARSGRTPPRSADGGRRRGVDRRRVRRVGGISRRDARPNGAGPIPTLPPSSPVKRSAGRTAADLVAARLALLPPTSRHVLSPSPSVCRPMPWVGGGDRRRPRRGRCARRRRRRGAARRGRRPPAVVADTVDGGAGYLPGSPPPPRRTALRRSWSTRPHLAAPGRRSRPRPTAAEIAADALRTRRCSRPLRTTLSPLVDQCGPPCAGRPPAVGRSRRLALATGARRRRRIEDGSGARCG